MAEPTIKQPNKHFTTTLYEGNGTAIGSGGKTITGLEFQPDFVWRLLSCPSSMVRVQLLLGKIMNICYKR